MNTPQEFAALRAGLRRLTERGLGSGGALATLVRTRGPTFRRPGARMLVCGDGTVVRGLSGGCPETDIIARAHDVIASGQPRLLGYDREHGLDALLELGCGGELEVLIEPLTTPAQLAFADAVAQCLRQRRSGFLATLFSRDGQCLQPQRLVWSEGRCLSDAIDSPPLRDALIERGRTLSPRAAPQTLELTANGHRHEVLFESLTPPQAAIIVGINAGALALARITAQLGWEVTLVYHRTDSGDDVLPDGVRRVHAPPALLRQALPLDDRSCAMVMTHNLERDIDYLRALADAPLAYLGAIGSRNRARLLIEGSGLEPPRLHAPAGLDLGAETPEEIALAIVAEMLAVTAGRNAAALSAGDGPMH